MFQNAPYPLYIGYTPNIPLPTPNMDYTRQRIVQIIVDVTIIILIFIIFIIVYTVSYPRVRGFYCSDTDIFYPYKPSMVPFYAVALYGTIGPILCIIFFELINAMRTEKPNPKTIFVVSTLHAISLFVLGIALTLVLTEIGKLWIGRLRPYFIDVCKPDFSQVICSTDGGRPGNVLYNFIDTSGGFCRGDANEIKQARLSFPSGHASYSCYTMGFLILYLEARARFVILRYVKVIIELAAFCAAYTTSISRISDYHHRGSDVIGGVILGVSIAIFVVIVVGRVLWNFGISRAYYDISER